MIDAAALDRMRPSARLINVGRGALVAEPDLVKALRAGRIAGAALDVFEDEPLPPSSPLWDMPNVIVSPHMSGDVIGWRDELLRLFAANLGRYVSGRPLRNVVDKRLGYVGSNQRGSHGRRGRSDRDRTGGGVRGRDALPVEAAEAVLARIRRDDPELNAFCLVDEETTLDMAREAAGRWRRGATLGPLDGVPVSIKDVLLTRGWPTLRGSTTIDPAGPWDEDAPSVARLREQGAVFVGKTTTPEFAWKGVTDNPLTGVTRNPWDPSRTPGGSSGGAAAAVAAGMAPLALGTDGGGSVRIPAAFTGTFTIKPTYGRVPHYPASPFGTLAHTGPMTNTVADAALLLDVVCGADGRDWSSLPPPEVPFTEAGPDDLTGLRIAFSPDLGFARVDPEVAASVAAAAEVFTELGAKVEQADPGFGDPVEDFEVLWFAGAAKVVEHLPPEAFARLDRACGRSASRARGTRPSSTSPPPPAGWSWAG